MTTFRSRRRIVSMMIAIVSLLHISPVLAEGDRGVVVRFTKWVTAEVQPPINDQPAAVRRLMAGTVRGDVGTGAFVGEVLDHRLSTSGHITVPINALEAIYEVQAGERSFEALIRGGASNGKGILDGVIMNGWQTGARVHVEFTAISRCDGNPNQTGPLATCFKGTIRIQRDFDDSDD